MSWDLLTSNQTQPLALTRSELWRRISQLLESNAPRHERLWNYYRNTLSPRTGDTSVNGSDRPYRMAQEWGVPSRITGRVATENNVGYSADSIARKEVVIEIDIGWRIDCAVDYLFGRGVTIRSRVSGERGEIITQLLTAIFEHNGGKTFLQHLGTLGSVHGFIDVLVKLNTAAAEATPTVQLDELATDAARASEESGVGDHDASLPPLVEPASRAETATPPAGPRLVDSNQTGTGRHSTSDALGRIARMIRLEIVEPARALPVLADDDWRTIDAYVQVYRARRTVSSPLPTKDGFLSRLGGAAGRMFKASLATQTVTISQIIAPTAWQRWENDRLVSSGENSLGEIPLVHIQNLPTPFEYSGVSDVEQLIPVQDELNTRLSDRANRISMQSFKMYLGCGIEGFTELPIAPGQMWMTDNTDAKIIEFGGDSSSPSEDKHIDELRDAMDKISAVTPIAAGIIRDRIGNLTSATALRVTLTSLLARTARKQGTYGQAIARMCELSLAWLNAAGLFQTSESERQVDVIWPDVAAVFDDTAPSAMQSKA